MPVRSVAETTHGPRRRVGASVVDILRAQREYARAQHRQTGLVQPAAFVRGMRRSGYVDTSSALAELIDNSLEAHARSIHIVFGFAASSTKPRAIAVVDDG